MTSNFSGNINPEDWYVTNVMVTRDSDLLEQSNWLCMLDYLEETKTRYSLLRFAHWACGWIEIATFKKDTSEFALRWIDTKLQELDDYPIWNDDHYSEIEQEDKLDQWENWVQYSVTKATEEFLANKTTPKSHQDFHRFPYIMKQEDIEFLKNLWLDAIYNDEGFSVDDFIEEYSMQIILHFCTNLQSLPEEYQNYLASINPNQLTLPI